MGIQRQDQTGMANLGGIIDEQGGVAVREEN